MKALSILQPWASLVVMGHKQIETRSWSTTYRGLLLIHASAGRKKEGRELCKDLRWGRLAADCDWYGSANFGAVIGCVKLVETVRFINCHPGTDFREKGRRWDLTEREYAFGDYSPGRYGWLLSEPVMFDKPIPCKGSLGLWAPDEATIKAIEKVLSTTGKPSL